MIDTVAEFFLGELPDEILSPVAYNIYFLFKMVFALILFLWILEQLRTLTKFFGRG